MFSLMTKGLTNYASSLLQASIRRVLSGKIPPEGLHLACLLVSLGFAEVPPTVVYDVYFELVHFLGFLVFSSVVDTLCCKKFGRPCGRYFDMWLSLNKAPWLFHVGDLGLS